MSSPFSTDGYADLRSYVQSNWNWIAVLDDGGTEHLRWDVDANSNASWTSGPSGNPLTAELEVTGQDIVDAGGSLPVTLASTEAYQSASATTAMGSDTMTDATLEATGDTVTITHDYELPPQ